MTETTTNPIERCHVDAVIADMSDMVDAPPPHPADLRVLMREIGRLRERVDRLVKIIGECTAALGNGSLIADEASDDFRAHLPEEIRLRVAKLERERDEARAEVGRLREALKPFAKAADNFDGMPISDPEQWFAYRGTGDRDSCVGPITVGDLRRARATMGGADV